MQPKIVTLTGPSCAGKSTLEKYLKARGFESVISTTTRKPRAGEVDGQSYYFISNEEFEQRVQDDCFIENVQFGGNRYGCQAAEIERLSASGKPIVVVVEPHGRQQIGEYCKKHGWWFVPVFVNNPQEVIFDRFLSRLIGEFGAGLIDGIDSSKLVHTAAKRLVVMTGTERQWVESANLDTYEIVLELFNQRNESDAVELICGLVGLYPPIDKDLARQAHVA